MCLCVCIILGKLRTLVASTSYRRNTWNYTRIKNNKRLLLKPFGYKVIAIFITHGCCFQTWEDSWRHLDTSKLNYSCIMAIATCSKALHQSKQHWALAPSIPNESYVFSSSTYFKSCAVHVTHNICFLVLRTPLCWMFHRTHWGSFFFFLDKIETKCKTYSIDKEETILKSFSYEVISTDNLVCIILLY